jgi:arylsulfatase A-like enzyme
MKIVYFDLDCLRADHLGCYGYHRNTSPNIDKIAKDGIIFTKCYTSNSPCLPSRAALFSGRFGINNGIVAHHPPGDIFRYPGYSHSHFEDMPMLMRHLRKHNIETISFSNFADRHTAWWFHSGFAEFHTISLKQGNETADEVNEVVLPWLKDHADEDNYFLHIHYWDIHTPYRLPNMQKWLSIFKNVPPPDWPDEKTIKSQYENMYGPRTARDLYTGYPADKRPDKFPWMPEKISTKEEFKMLIDGYDASIYYVDYHIEQVLNIFKEKGILDEIIFIISCDHGDSFGENGGHYMDHTLANEAVHRLPLIIKWPGITKGSTCNTLIYQLDLAPTLCEMLNIPIPPKWDGISFADALKGKNFNGRNYLVFDHGIYTFQRSVRTKDYLFTRTYHPALYPIDEPYELFDMNKDIHQTKSIAKEKPEIVKEHQNLLTEWWHEQLPKHSPHPDPLEVMVGYGPFLYYKPEQMVKRLRETGRNNKAEELIKRLSKYNHKI